MTSAQSVLASFAVILLDLAVRAGLDKVLALYGSPAMVAMWAQLQSVVELMSSVALAGIAQGLTVHVAQARSSEEEGGLLRAALRLGPAIAFSVALLFLFAAPRLQPWLMRVEWGMGLLMLAALTGCIAVLPGIMTAYWLGRHRQQRVLQFALLSSLPWGVVAWVVYSGGTLPDLAAAQCLTLLLVALPMWWYMHRLAGHAAGGTALRSLAHFIPVGLAIGILSPVSMLFVRGVLASALSWNDAGLMQALWRSSEWVTSIAAGVLSLIFLPRLSATSGTLQFAAELRRAAMVVLPPSALLLLLIFFQQRAVLSALYDARFAVGDEVVALFMLGCLLRIAAWVFLYGLYAARRIWLIVWGEVLSLPLFAFLLWWQADRLSLERVALLYCLSYVAYLAFTAAGLIYSRPWRGATWQESATDIRRA